MHPQSYDPRDAVSAVEILDKCCALSGSHAAILWSIEYGSGIASSGKISLSGISSDTGLTTQAIKACLCEIRQLASG